MNESAMIQKNHSTFDSAENHRYFNFEEMN